MTIRQYNMLGEFMRRDRTIAQVLRFEQRTFGSLCKHHWLRYNVESETFTVTPDGEHEHQFYSASDRLFRSNTKRPLSMYAPKRASKVTSIKRVA